MTPPPPPPPLPAPASSTINEPCRPVIRTPALNQDPQSIPVGAYLVELAVYNGYPFKDHWAYFVRSHQDDQIGVKVHATGDVRNGFKLEAKRSHDLRDTEDIPQKKIPLLWVDGKYFDDGAMLNHGVPKIDGEAVCGFEKSAYKVAAPGKSLNHVDEDNMNRPGNVVKHRDCQTWIVESADQLVLDGIFVPEVAEFLRNFQQ